MTDNEIIEELKRAIRLAVYVDSNYADGISIELLECTLELINRQQAEIERLNTLAELGNMRANDYRAMRNKAKTARDEAIKEFAEKLKEEIEQALESNYTAKAERMSKTNDCTDTFVICCIGKILALSDINDYIDNLVKEMVGGEND